MNKSELFFVSILFLKRIKTLNSLTVMEEEEGLSNLQK